MTTQNVAREQLQRGDTVTISMTGKVREITPSGSVRIEISTPKDGGMSTTFSRYDLDALGTTITRLRPPLPTTPGSVVEHTETHEKFILLGRWEGLGNLGWFGIHDGRTAGTQVEAYWNAGTAKISTTP